MPCCILGSLLLRAVFMGIASHPSIFLGSCLSQVEFVIYLLFFFIFSSPFYFLPPSQVKYKRDFEESKGRGFSIVTDTPELQRLKRTQEQISNVGACCLVTWQPWSVCGWQRESGCLGGVYVAVVCEEWSPHTTAPERSLPSDFTALQSLAVIVIQYLLTTF